MSYQRRRTSLTAYVWLVEEQTDSRNNVHKVPVRQDKPIKVWVFPQNSGKAEVPGQQHINITRIGVPIMEGLDLWSRVELLGKVWDVAAPPAYHHGTRHTRHYSVDIRERP